MDSNPEQESINAAHKMMRISRIHLDIGNIPAAIEDCSDYNIFTSAVGKSPLEGDKALRSHGRALLAMSRVEGRAADKTPVGANIDDPTGGNTATTRNKVEDPKPNSARMESLCQPEEHKTSKMDNQPVMLWLDLIRSSQ